MPDGETGKLEYCPLQAKGCDKVNNVENDMKEVKTELINQSKTISRIDLSTSGMNTTLKDIKKHLIGNGREGLFDRVTRVEGKTKFTMWFCLLIIAGIILAGINWLVKLGS